MNLLLLLLLLLLFLIFNACKRLWIRAEILGSLLVTCIKGDTLEQNIIYIWSDLHYNVFTFMCTLSPFF